MAAVCASVQNRICEHKELHKCLEEGDATCDMDEDEAIEGVRHDALYPEEVINAKLGGYWDTSLGLDLPWKDEHFKTCVRIDRAIDDLFAEETKCNAAELGGSGVGMMSAGGNRTGLVRDAPMNGSRQFAMNSWLSLGHAC